MCQSVLVPQLIMKLYGLLLMFSLVLADGDTCDFCDEDCSSEIPTTIPDLPEITCFLHKVNLLNCSWSTDFPKDAQYSASSKFCDSAMDHPMTCSTKSVQSVECHGRLEGNEGMENIDVKVNISINGSWSIICNCYSIVDIEKLDPPQNITTLSKSLNLAIQWSMPGTWSSEKESCFIHELKINDETVRLEGFPVYNKTNFQPTETYIIQIRTKLSHICSASQHWSDWSEAVVVVSPVDQNQLDAGVIASIALVLPMILLTFLLFCKFQRLFEKLFPSIPNPSKNVQKLLQNDFKQVMSPKSCEEGAEILEVIS